MPTKKNFSSRIITNSLIVLFGIVILTITLAASWKAWLTSADNVYIQDKVANLYISLPQATFATASEKPKYTIRKEIADTSGNSRDYLEIYDSATIASTLGSAKSSSPTNAASYVIGSNKYRSVIIPITNYNYETGSNLSTNSITFKLLTYALTVASSDDDKTAISNAIKSYESAISSKVGGISVLLSPAVNTSPADAKTIIPISVSVDPTKITPSSIDHISVFATGADQTFSPTNDDSGKKAICTAAGGSKPAAPLASLLGATTCNTSGDCGKVNFVAPETSGTHQIFAVAMKSSVKTACSTSNILGWSILDGTHLISIYKGEVESGADLTVSYPSTTTVGSEFFVRVQSNNAKIDHISLFISRADTYSWSEITNTTICSEANAEDKGEKCKLCLQGKSYCTSGKCDTEIPVTLNQSGQHRIVAVGVSDDGGCSASNLVTINKEGIITVASIADVNGDGKPDDEEGGGPNGGPNGGTSGGNEGSSNNTANKLLPDWAVNFGKSSATTIQGFLEKLGPFTLLVLGFFAVLAIIVAGMKYITAGGNQKNAEVGKKGVLFAIYGIILAILCVFLIKTTINEVKIIVGETIPDPANPGTILSGLGGPNSSMLDIIGHSATKTGLIWRIIQLLVYYAEVVAVFYILYASFLYLTSQGDDSKAENAKKTLIWAVIGIAFILATDIILKIFAEAII